MIYGDATVTVTVDCVISLHVTLRSHRDTGRCVLDVNTNRDIARYYTNAAFCFSEKGNLQLQKLEIILIFQLTCQTQACACTKTSHFYYPGQQLTTDQPNLTDRSLRQTITLSNRMDSACNLDEFQTNQSKSVWCAVRRGQLPTQK